VGGADAGSCLPNLLRPGLNLYEKGCTTTPGKILTDDNVRLGIRSLFISIAIIGVLTILAVPTRNWCLAGDTGIGRPFAFYDRGFFSEHGRLLGDGILEDTGYILLGALLIGIVTNHGLRTKRDDLHWLHKRL